MTTKDLISILPLMILVGWACILLLLDAFITGDKEGWTAIFAALGLAVVLGFSVAQFGQEYRTFNDMIVVDGFARFLNVIFAGSGIIAIALAYDYLKRMDLDRGEFYALLMFSISGMLLMSMAADLIVIFLALELLSIPLYVLAGFARPKLESEEAALKYFLLGAFASGFVVYGVALCFGAAATTSLGDIVSAIMAGTADLSLLVTGAALIFIGLGFKVAVVPFHMWTPDVYHGAPSPVAGFMAIGAKAAGFAALLRVYLAALPSLADELVPVVWAIAAITMFVGNIVAIAQRNIKRMLAYSSIAHAGYILMAFVTFGQSDVAGDTVAATLFYLVAYALTNLGSWAVVIALEQKEGRGLNLDDYFGLSTKYPGLAASMAVFMLSFIGVPPTLGFLGKFYLFRTVLQGGYVWLAIIGVVTSLISAYYYLRVVVNMYMHEGEPAVRLDPWLRLVSVGSAIGVVLLSLLSIPLFNWASKAILT
ncbi:MAG: NADH-quinone oxidoreductase subunit N, partial [Chloroflexota bacterium]